MVSKKRSMDIWYDLRVYFSFLKKYSWIFVGTLLLVLIVEGVHVFNKYLFKIVIDRSTDYVAGIVSLPDFVTALIVVAVVFLCISIIGASCQWLRIHGLTVIEAKLIADVKRKFFDHIVHLHHGFHATHRTGSLISRLSRAGGATERLTDVIILNMAPLVSQLILVGVSLLVLDKSAALVLILTVVVFVVYSLVIQRIMTKANIAQNIAEDTEKANMGDIFANIDSIKYFGKEEMTKHRFRKLSEITKKLTLKNWGYFRWFDVGQDIILAVGTFFLVYLPLVKFLNGQVTLGDLAFLYTAYTGLRNPLFGFVHGMLNFYRGIADLDALFAYGKIINTIKDKPMAKPLKIKQGTIEFRNVWFSYHKRPLFENFTLVIPKNKKVALVGHSGSGKSTLVKLLYRFYDVDHGEILIDGINIKDIKQESLRSELSIVPQECMLFDDTVYSNIEFSKPHASRQEVMQAIKFAQLDTVVQEFPKKERTIVGERGIKLSGGEKQRVSIARAILSNKKVLVLDEATSSLDSETEHEIQKDLEDLMKDRTSIIIAHRLSTIMKADLIVVMKHGKIIQTGTHRKLIARKGEYRKLWKLQKGGYIE